METVEEIREDHNPDLKLEGIIVNQFQAQASLPTQLIESMKADGLPIFDQYLSSSVKMKESRSRQIPLIHYAPSHKLTQQLVSLHDKLDSGKKSKSAKSA